MPTVRKIDSPAPGYCFEHNGRCAMAINPDGETWHVRHYLANRSVMTCSLGTTFAGAMHDAASFALSNSKPLTWNDWLAL